MEFPMSDRIIRPATPDDYSAIADLINSNASPIPATAATLRESDQRRPAYCKMARWVAEGEDCLVGFGFYEQIAHMYDPSGVHARVLVHPDHREQGIGRELYNTLEHSIAAQGIRTIRTVVQEDSPSALAFSHHRGFQEEQRVFESALDLTTFDPAVFAHITPRLAEQGIDIRSYADLKGDPEFDRVVYELATALVQDIPSPVPYSMPAFEVFCEQTFRNPKVPHGGILFALVGKEPVGMIYQRAYNEQQMNIDLSGVRQEYRGRGIAFALKVAGATVAKNDGIQSLRTTNDSTNPAILAINRKMGFVPRPATLMMRKELL
jgi:mycothiol synthase